MSNDDPKENLPQNSIIPPQKTALTTFLPVELFPGGCEVCGELSAVERESCMFCGKNADPKTSAVVHREQFGDECPACGATPDERKLCPICQKK